MRRKKKGGGRAKEREAHLKNDISTFNVVLFMTYRHSDLIQILLCLVTEEGRQGFTSSEETPLGVELDVIQVHSGNRNRVQSIIKIGDVVAKEGGEEGGRGTMTKTDRGCVLKGAVLYRVCKRWI